MDRITMPSALLSQILRTQDLRQKQVVIRHRGRSPEIDLPSSPMLLRIKNKTKKTKKQKPHVNSTSNL